MRTEQIICQFDNVKMPHEIRRDIIAVTEFLEDHPQAIKKLEAIIKAMRNQERKLAEVKRNG